MEHTKPSTLDGSPLRLVHSRAPVGCTSETTSTVQTAAGPVTIRVRRLSVSDYVGGRGYVPSWRIEVAVNAPATDGFQIVDGHYLDNWRQPSDDLAVHIHFGAQLAEVAEKRAARHTPASAPDRPAARPDRGAAPAPERKPTPSPRVPAVGREALRRLLHVRGQQYERHTGTDWTAERHARVFALTGRQSSKGLDMDALSVLVDDLTADLEAAGFDVAAADAAYEARSLAAPVRRAA